MLFIARIHRSWEKKLDVWLGLVHGRRVHILLALVLHIALDSLFNLHNDLARQVGQQINGFLFPSDTRVCLKEVRDIVVCGLRN